MAVGFDDYPKNKDSVSFVESPCYCDLMEEYRVKRTTKWSTQYLIEKYGKAALNEMLAENFLVMSRNGTVILSFLIHGTIPNLIASPVAQRYQFYSFNEYLKKVKIPNSSVKLAPTELKNFVEFLRNFEQVQMFPLPCSALTLITKEGDNATEKVIDCLTDISRYLEPQLVYKSV